MTVEPEAGGSHIRVVLPGGPVHLFRPSGYRRRAGGIVVYVHGYYTRIDEAWREHKLGAQFAASRRNALFIAPEAPISPEEQPAWPDLRRLISSALGRAHLREPPGPLVVVGHSGAYRTIVPWLNEPTLHNLILIDALYGNGPDFRAWLDASRNNRMTLVVKGTTKITDPFVRALDDAVTVPEIPKSLDQLSGAERSARVLCLRSQYGHFELITDGVVMPVLLGRAKLSRLRGARRPTSPVMAGTRRTAD